MITSNKWLATLNANNPLVTNGANGPQPSIPTPLSQHQPLDLSLAAMASGFQPQSCSDCKELRKEVRDVKTSLQALIQQFNAFAGRWGPLTHGPDSVSALGETSQKRHRSHSPSADEKPTEGHKDSPPSSLSSVEWGGDIPVMGMQKDPGSSSPSSGTTGDGRHKLSSPDSASSSDSLGISGAKKRKLSFQQKSHGNPQSMANLAQGLKTHQANQYLAAAHQAQMDSMLSGLRAQGASDPYLPLLHSQLLGGGNPAFNNLQHLLMGWQNLAGGKSAAEAALLNSLGTNPFHGGLPTGLPTGLNLGTSNHNATDRSVSSSNQSPLGVVTSGSERPQSTVRDTQSAASHHLDNLVKKSKMASSPMSQSGNEKEIFHGSRKKPGPDDFIKEFVEHPEIDAAEAAAAEKSFQIPVPEAFESDPEFRPVSEEEILGSTKWEELEWQEAVTRLAKKLAERRVFGPMLMAKATVAGTNHSNYPNLPMDGILYIESVCRRTLFPQMARRQFAEFFRPAVKGLAARCRRIRHSLKPNNGNASFLLNQSTTSLEDTSFSDLSPGQILPATGEGNLHPALKEESREDEEGGIIDPQ